VEILDHEQERLPFPEPVEDAEDGLQHPGLDPVRAGRRVAGIDRASELGYEATERRTGGSNDLLDNLGRQLPRQRAERVGDRGERQPLVVAEADRGSFEDRASTLADDPAQFGDEATLADPGLAAHQDGRRQADDRGVPRRTQGTKLRVAADQDWTRDPRRHAPDHRQRVER
jgi:hypothetical protein